MAETVKNIRATQETLETWVRSLDQEDSLGGGNGNPLQHSCLKLSREQRSLAGYSPWGHKELDMIEMIEHTQCPKITV